jgi:hypothetical protein
MKKKKKNTRKDRGKIKAKSDMVPVNKLLTKKRLQKGKHTLEDFRKLKSNIGHLLKIQFEKKQKLRPFFHVTNKVSIDYYQVSNN